MSAIKVKVSELYEQVKLMKDDGMIYATLSILKQDPKYDVPTSLFIEACNDTNPIDVSYDSLYSVE